MVGTSYITTWQISSEKHGLMMRCVRNFGVTSSVSGDTLVVQGLCYLLKDFRQCLILRVSDNS